MSKRVFNLADKLVVKYAKEEDIPETLRSGLTNSPLPPTRYVSPQIEEPLGRGDIKPSRLDTNDREVVGPNGKKLLDVLDIMIYANIITPTYYENATRFLHKNPTNLSRLHQDIIQIAHKAQEEVVTYQKRLNMIKALLSK